MFLKRNPTVLVRCIIREREYGDNKAPLHSRGNANLDIIDSKENEISLLEFNKTAMALSLHKPTGAILSTTSPPKKSDDVAHVPKSTPKHSTRLVNQELALLKFVSTPYTDKNCNGQVDQHEDYQQSTSNIPDELPHHVSVQYASDEQLGIMTPYSND